MASKLAVLLVILLQVLTFIQAKFQYVGVNEAGPDFGAPIGVLGVDYIFPTNASIDHFISKGVNVFRLPFLWERMQPTLDAPFNDTFFGHYAAVVEHITCQNAYALLDPHNYYRYFGQIVGEGGPTVQQFIDFWAQLAGRFRDNDKVIFGLMNEPNTLGSSNEVLVQGLQGAINKIRQIGAHQLILVPGSAWTGAAAFDQTWYGTPNNEQIYSNITDPIHNWALDVHQYFDGAGGSNPTCDGGTGNSSFDIGSYFTDINAWIVANKKRAFLSEFAGGNNADCNTKIVNLLIELSSIDNWIGITWWAAGPWWGNYIFTLEPNTNGYVDQPQWTNVLSKFVPPGTVPTS